MHHLYPSVKGDPLCPLGFHPQVRWPTRCKRCFRDYKEHGGRKKDDEGSSLRRDDVTISSPSLSTWSSASSRSRDESRSGSVEPPRSWASSTSLSTGKDESDKLSNRTNPTVTNTSGSRFGTTPASWTSTPDLANLSNNTQANTVTYNFTLPKKKPLTIDTGQESITLKKPDYTIKKGDSLAERVKKLQASKGIFKTDTPSNTSSLSTRKAKAKETKEVKEIKEVKEVKEIKEPKVEQYNHTHDVQFLIQVKSKSPFNKSHSASRRSVASEESDNDRDDSASNADTDTTDTTLVGHDTDLQEQIESLKQELESVKTRCERAEREKTDILLRRLASYETTPNKTTASEVLKLQQKVNELQTNAEDLVDEKKSLSLRVKELEEELESRPTSAEAKRVSDELQAKLSAAETLCEELMDENEDMKKELRDLEEEIEEMQDNFREDQANEYSSLKKELEQTSKNCRILSFKLRKAERRSEELEAAKLEVEQKFQEVAGDNALNHVERIKHLEQELKVANEVSLRLQKELEETTSQLTKAEGKQAASSKKKPMLGSIGKVSSADGKVSRASLTRGGSQEDPVQLLRDLQDSMERENDLREQLRFAEEELRRQRRSIKSRGLIQQRSDLDVTLKRSSPLVVEPNSLPTNYDLQIPNMESLPPDLINMLQHFLSPSNAGKLIGTQFESTQTDEQCQKKSTGTQTIPASMKNFAQQIKIALHDSQTQTDSYQLSDNLTQTDIVSTKDTFTETRPTEVPSPNLINNSSQTLGHDNEIAPQILQSKQIGPSPFSMSLPFMSSLRQAQNLRRKTSRIEDDNESLVLQLKKMATKARSRKLSPTATHHLSPESSIDKDEGISDLEDPAELKLLLELNEQEAAVLRRKVEDLEAENDTMSKKIKDLHEKLANKTLSKTSVTNSSSSKSSAIDEQKNKVREEELSDLRKRIIEKDRDYERLHAELTLMQKQRAKGTLIKSKSLDGDQMDLKRQLEVIEQEATVLHGKIKSLETENEKLMSENKKLQLLSGTKKVSTEKSVTSYVDKIISLETEVADAKKKITELEEKATTAATKETEVAAKKKLKDEIDKLKDQLKKIETEKKDLSDKLTDLRAEAIKIKPRSPKRPTDLTTKLQMKKMVLDLENEIGDIIVLLKNSETAKFKLENDMKMQSGNTKTSSELEASQKELTDIKKKLVEVEKDLLSEKKQASKNKEEIKTVQVKYEEALDKCKQLEKGKDLVESEHHKVVNDRTKLETQIKELNTEIKTANNKIKEADKLNSEINSIKQETAVKEKEIDKLKKDLEKLSKVEQEKLKLNKEVDEKVKKISTLEIKLKDNEDKLKEKEKIISTKMEAIEKLEKTVISSSIKVGDSDAIKPLEEQLAKSRTEVNGLKEKYEHSESAKRTFEENVKNLKDKLATLQKHTDELESDLKTQKDVVIKTKTNLEKELKLKDSEITKLESKIKILDQTSGIRNKKIADVKKECDEQMLKLREELKTEKQEYEDLTAKYEILEEEHVVTKAQLVTEKETLLSQLHNSEMSLETISNELQTLRDTYNHKQDAWIKEKLNMQEKLKSIESAGTSETLAMERNRFKSTIDDKQSEIEQLRKEADVIQDQLNVTRKENEELKRKLDDFDKVSKIQRNISADTTAMEKEIRALTNRCTNAEKLHKIEITQCKMRYDNQVGILNEELQSLQDQVSRFKRERDNFKHMLESAQKTMVDLKTTGKHENRTSMSSNFDELEESRTKVATLEQQVSCMEDELSEARLETSKLKTELVSERSTWEIKLSEFKTRVNELEEERILASGRSKIPGQRTRMELAWQKEREEQQRLLQETSTLARDLRQTLFEVERERDKERLESKRKQDQLKKFVEEEQDENRKKITEIQCDLLELRDAHAKLRTTNEKLRREKERHEREYEEMRSTAVAKRRAEQEEDRKLTSLLEQVEELTKLVPDLYGQPLEESNTLLAMTPTAPRRMKGPKSRESSPSLDRRSMSKEPSPRRDNKQTQIQSTLQRLTDATEELRKYQRLGDVEREKERTKRFGMRRAASTENENGPDSVRAITTRKNGIGEKGSLKRRSLSLEQTSGIRPDQVIWKGDDDSLSSLQSLDSRASTSGKYLKQDSSLDSRLSGGSTQSEINTSDVRKKKKGFIGKLKKLTKSHSIDDSMEHGSRGDASHHQGSDSDISISEDHRSSRKDLKGRITGIFRKAGSSSRSNSLERSRKETTPDSSSTQRPLTKNGSNNTLNRSTPVRGEDSSASSTASKSTLKIKKK